MAIRMNKNNAKFENIALISHLVYRVEKRVDLSPNDSTASSFLQPRHINKCNLQSVVRINHVYGTDNSAESMEPPCFMGRRVNTLMWILKHVCLTYCY